jgi:type I restriction enzyme R subunit
VLVQDWFRDEQSKKRVRSEIESVLDADLPESYERAVFKRKCENVFDLVLDHAAHGRRWAA